jgi:hypothetical protein
MIVLSPVTSSPHRRPRAPVLRNKGEVSFKLCEIEKQGVLGLLAPDVVSSGCFNLRKLRGVASLRLTFRWSMNS